MLPISNRTDLTPIASLPALYNPRDLALIRRTVAYSVQRCTRHHIKIGPVNFYPSRGKITIDPDSSHPEKGFEALLQLLANMKKNVLQLRFDN
jgi:hypothetical protein